METFIEARPFAIDPDYRTARSRALDTLDLSEIDVPIADLIEDFADLPHCFTLQSCWGHFVHDGQPDPRGCAPLAHYNRDTQFRFQLAYIALCLENSANGLALRDDLCRLVELDPANIQFGSAEWFWKRRVNSYVLQVEPKRYMDVDRAMIGLDEALYLERLKARFFVELRKVVDSHRRLKPG
jgi:hypothetical protein